MRKGQIDQPVVLFAIIVLGLLIFAPISLKVFNSIKNPVSASLGNITGGGATAQANFDKVMNTLTTFWDKVIMFAFITSLIILFISAFLIDAHPIFIIIYILINFMLVLFAPNMIEAVDHIYTDANFNAEVQQLTFMNELRTHYAEFLVGIMIITGIIIYGKIYFINKTGGANGGSYR